MDEEMTIRPMRKEDIAEVSQIEKLSFPSPWSSNIFRAEIEKESFAFYHVMEYRDRLIGYWGYWRIKNEAHLVTFAVHPDFRRKGRGAKLLEHLLEDAQDQSLDVITLEARHSNLVAQKFYERFGFKKIAIHPHYYSDNDEDAIVYWKKV